MEEYCASGLFSVRIPEVFSKYKTVGILEKGGFSVVTQAQDTKTGKFVACKIVSREGLTKNGLFNRFEQELRIQETLDHPNIAKIIDVIYFDDIIIVVLEYFVNRDVISYITEVGVLTVSDSMRIMKNLVSAVAYLHHRNIAHRDIKLENIVLDHSYNPVLIDFGACTCTQSLRNTLVGSHYYIPPEVWFKKEYDAKAADVWALGVTCFVMMTGGFPWKSENEAKLMEEIRRGKFIIPDISPPELNKFVKMAIVVDPEQRADIDQLEAILSVKKEKVPPILTAGSVSYASKPFFSAREMAELQAKTRTKRNFLKSSGLAAIRPIRSGQRIPGKPPSPML